MTERAQDLADALRSEGEVEVRLSGTKVVAFGLAFLVGGPAVLIATLGAEGPIQLAFAVGLSVLVWLVNGTTFAEWVFGAGPVLRVDKDGVTIRRWRKPMHLEWSDVLAFEAGPHPRGPALAFLGPSLQMLMSVWVWHDYRAARPRWSGLIEDRFGGHRRLVPYRLFTVSHADLLEFLSPELIEEMTVLRHPFRLVLDFSEVDESPLWLRGGRNVDLDAIPLSAGLQADVQAWKGAFLHLADEPPQDHGGDLESSEFDERLAPIIDHGRTLATRMTEELGDGSVVLSSIDVPTRPVVRVGGLRRA